MQDGGEDDDGVDGNDDGDVDGHVDGDIDSDADGDHDTEKLNDYEVTRSDLDNSSAPRIKIELDLEAMKERDWRWKRRMTALEIEGTTSQPPSPSKEIVNPSKASATSASSRALTLSHGIGRDQNQNYRDSQGYGPDCRPRWARRSTGEQLTEVMSEAFDHGRDGADMETFCDSDSDIDGEAKRVSEAKRKKIRAYSATVDGSDATET